MQDLIDALKSLTRSPELPDNQEVILSDVRSPIDRVHGGRILLDRIDEMAHESLLFNEGRLQGQPDHFNQEMLAAEGFEVTEARDDRSGRYVGVIHTRKGRIVFE